MPSEHGASNLPRRASYKRWPPYGVRSRTDNRRLNRPVSISARVAGHSRHPGRNPNQSSNQLNILANLDSPMQTDEPLDLDGSCNETGQGEREHKNMPKSSFSVPTKRTMLRGGALEDQPMEPVEGIRMGVDRTPTRNGLTHSMRLDRSSEIEFFPEPEDINCALPVNPKTTGPLQSLTPPLDDQSLPTECRKNRFHIPTDCSACTKDIKPPDHFRNGATPPFSRCQSPKSPANSTNTTKTSPQISTFFHLSPTSTSTNSISTMALPRGTVSGRNSQDQLLVEASTTHQLDQPLQNGEAEQQEWNMPSTSHIPYTNPAGGYQFHNITGGYHHMAYPQARYPSHGTYASSPVYVVPNNAHYGSHGHIMNPSHDSSLHSYGQLQRGTSVPAAWGPSPWNPPHYRPLIPPPFNPLGVPFAPSDPAANFINGHAWNPPSPPPAHAVLAARAAASAASSMGPIGNSRPEHLSSESSRSALFTRARREARQSSLPIFALRPPTTLGHRSVSLTPSTVSIAGLANYAAAPGVIARPTIPREPIPPVGDSPTPTPPPPRRINPSSGRQIVKAPTPSAKVRRVGRGWEVWDESLILYDEKRGVDVEGQWVLVEREDEEEYVDLKDPLGSVGKAHGVKQPS